MCFSDTRIFVYSMSVGCIDHYINAIELKWGCKLNFPISVGGGGQCDSMKNKILYEIWLNARPNNDDK